MPNVDDAQQRQAQRAWWKAEYKNSPAFRRKELRRKKAERATWSSDRKEHNREYMRDFMRAYRAKLKKAGAAKRVTKSAKLARVASPVAKRSKKRATVR